MSSAAGGQATLVLVPGLLCDAGVWAEQVEALAADIRVVVAENELLDSLGAMAARILAGTSGSLLVAGHSMGGRVALEVLRQAPARVAALALLDSGCHALPAGEAGERERAARMAFLELARTEGMRAMSERWLQDMVYPARRADQSLTGRIVAMQTRRSPEHLAAQTTALLARPEAGDVLRAANCPVLLLTGSDDRNSPPQANREMAGMVARGSLALLQECGHMAPMERPAQVTVALRSWLATVR